MKKIQFLCCFLFLNSIAFGQQILWTTIENTSSKYVPIENITYEVLNFYNHYRFYNDGSGYTKSNFLNAIEKYGDKSDKWNNFKQTILKIENSTVFAIRSNTGYGSIVLVICVTKENVNFVSFSNSSERGSQLASGNDEKEFSNWFQTLLN
jgi:hypothetical protein